MNRNIIVQEFDLEIEGKGLFAIQTTGGECMIPTFGYNEKGEVISRRIAEEEGYAPLKQEWIDEQIVLAAESFRKGKKDDLVYVAVIKKSDALNEIGIAVDSNSMSIESSSVTASGWEYEF